MAFAVNLGRRGAFLKFDFENLAPAVCSVDGVDVVGAEGGSVLLVFGEKGCAERLVSTAAKAAAAFGLFAFGLAHVCCGLRLVFGLEVKGVAL
jgi:hypothetical protein